MCLRTRFLEEQLELSLLILTISSLKGDFTGDDKISMMSAMSSSTEVEQNKQRQLQLFFKKTSSQAHQGSGR
jgi:hypothetical protein